MFQALPRLSLKHRFGDQAGLCSESLNPSGTGERPIDKHEGGEWKIRTDSDHLSSVLDARLLTHRQTTSVHGVQEGTWGVSIEAGTHSGSGGLWYRVLCPWDGARYNVWLPEGRGQDKDVKDVWAPPTYFPELLCPLCQRESVFCCCFFFLILSERNEN